MFAQSLNKILLSMGAAAVGFASSAHAQISVAPGVHYAVGLRPSGVAVGDLNGDGHVDLATSTDTQDKINTLLNDGAGNFVLGPVIFLPNSSSPADVLAGDFDGDGDADLAVILRSLNQVRILVNNGGGSFSTGASASVGSNARGMDMADIDGDGDLDLGVANRDSNTATVLRNNGDGTFVSVTVPQPAGAEPRAVAFGNFAGPGLLGMAVSNHDIRTVNVFAQNGGGFSPIASLFVGSQDRPDGIAAADLNGDGLADVAAVSGDDTPSLNRVVVFHSTGGSFTGPMYVPTGAVMNSSDIVAADLDCDGMIDLAVTNQDSNNMSLLRNLGGGFSGPIITSTGTRPGRVNVGDFDADGDLDLAVANRDSNNVSVYRNDSCAANPPVCGNGVCEAGENNQNCPGDCPPGGPVCGNGVCEAGENNANCPGDCPPPTPVCGNGICEQGENSTNCPGDCGGLPPGDFNFVVGSLFVGHQPSGAAVGDFNGDGLHDIAVTADVNTNSDNIAILLRTGTGSFAPPVYINLPNSSSPEALVAGDLDGDGDIDLAVGLKDFNVVRVLVNNGAGNFTLGASAPTGAQPRGMQIADAEGDGDLDLVVANRDGNNVTVLLNNGNGTFAATTLTAGLEPRDATWGDFDGDGDMDLAVSNHDDRTISVFRNNGGTAFTLATTLNVGSQDRPEGIIAADLNGDGRADIAAASGDTTAFWNRAVVFHSIGKGIGFSGAMFFPAGPGAIDSSDIIAADLDCDGDLDLALANKGSNNVSVLANTGSGFFSAAVLAAVGSAPDHIITADFDGDGDGDLITVNRNSSSVSTLTNVACAPLAPGDATGDGAVNVNDLLRIINSWGSCPLCPADVAPDTIVNVNDLLKVINNWG